MDWEVVVILTIKKKENYLSALKKIVCQLNIIFFFFWFLRAVIVQIRLMPFDQFGVPIFFFFCRNACEQTHNAEVQQK